MKMKILMRTLALGALITVVAVATPSVGATRHAGAKSDPLNPDTFTYLGHVTSAGVTDSSGKGNTGLVSGASGGTVTEGNDAAYGAVLRFPPATCLTAPAGGSCPRATVSPQNEGALNPLGGTGDFAFGATVRMSSVAGTAGMNILERGVFGPGQDQWKLQTDYENGDGFRAASCRFSDGTNDVILIGTKKLKAGLWYDLTCRRSGSTFSLVVAQVSGSAADETVSARATLGAIAPTRAATIGGKAITSGAGQTDLSVDQFHGDLEGVFFRRIAS
jgi:hypothetical protein